MTREPLEYPGDPYNDPDYDEIAILKAEIERLRAALMRIDGINDSPAHFNIEIDGVLRRALEPKP